MSLADFSTILYTLLIIWQWARLTFGVTLYVFNSIYLYQTTGPYRPEEKQTHRRRKIWLKIKE